MPKSFSCELRMRVVEALAGYSEESSRAAAVGGGGVLRTRCGYERRVGLREGARAWAFAAAGVWLATAVERGSGRIGRIAVRTGSDQCGRGVVWPTAERRIRAPFDNGTFAVEFAGVTIRAGELRREGSRELRDGSPDPAGLGASL